MDGIIFYLNNGTIEALFRSDDPKRYEELHQTYSGNSFTFERLNKKVLRDQVSVMLAYLNPTPNKRLPTTTEISCILDEECLEENSEGGL